MSLVRDLALALRFLLELAAIVAVGWWGFALDAPAAVRVLAGVAASLVVIAVWGAVVSPRARFALPRWRREATEDLVWLAAVVALISGGATAMAVALAVLIVLDRIALHLTAGTVSRLEGTPE